MHERVGLYVKKIQDLHQSVTGHSHNIKPSLGHDFHQIFFSSK